MNSPMSAAQFHAFVTMMILALAIGWAIVDSVRLRRALREVPSPERRDRIFGCFMGLTIAALGMGGVAYFHVLT